MHWLSKVLSVASWEPHLLFVEQEMSIFRQESVAAMDTHWDTSQQLEVTMVMAFYLKGSVIHSLFYCLAYFILTGAII